MARSKKQIWYFDLEKLERNTEPLNQTELDVRRRLVCDGREQLFARLDLEAALAVLTERQCACFLRYADGHTYRAIAAALGVSLPTVQQHIQVARQKLRKYLSASS